MQDTQQFINFFRQAAPYIRQHRNKTFVFCLPDDSSMQAGLKSLLHDIAILHSLHVRIIIVYGVRHTLNKRLSNQKFHQNQRVTDVNSVNEIQEMVGGLGIQIEAMLSMGLANSPMQGASISTVSGNFIIAKPLGVIDGVDYGLTGDIRKINVAAIDNQLDQGSIALIPPLGYSSTGEVFNLTSETVARSVAAAVKADKLIFFNNDIKTLNGNSQEGQAITPKQATKRALKNTENLTLQTVLNESAHACNQDVGRVHIIPPDTNGALLAELFTLDGLGLMITNEAYDRIEQATVNDISSLLELIRPLEEKGILVRRSRDLLEMEITHFSLLKRDNTVIGCAALYPYENENIAELGCLAISSDYQKNGLADRLLNFIEQRAKNANIKKLFCLTTNTSHWFMERGFEPITIDKLPEQKKAFYNFDRNSKCYLKKIN